MPPHVIIEIALLGLLCAGLFPLTAWLDKRKALNEWLNRVIGPEIGREK